MDEYLFRQFLDECREVSEATSYVEILNYSVSGRPPGREDRQLRGKGI